jgi:hypothetical protein
MSSLLSYVDLTLAGYVAVSVATLVFSQKIKDWFSGVPSDLRTGLKSVESGILADVKNYQASLVHKLAPMPPPAEKPPVTVAVNPAPAPAAPAPAAPAA